MKTTNYDISVDAADLLEDLEGHHELMSDPAASLVDDLELHDVLVSDSTVVRDDVERDGDAHSRSREHSAAELDGQTHSTSREHSAGELDGQAHSTSREQSADHSTSVSSLRARRAARALPPPDLNIIDEDDLDWVARLIDIVASCRGQPWRVALEHIDGAQYLDRPVPHQQFVAAVQALQRLLSRSHRAQLARACRELVLGHPALSQTTRADRIAAAARALEISCDDVERLLWADLPRERPVELPFGRPSELEVAAFANVQLIQRAVRRAQTITIAVRGDAGPLIRGASTRGLIAMVRVARPEGRAVVAGGPREEDDITILDIVGPLTLCHRTAVYGRALASLVPLLVECSAFELTLSATGITGPYRSRLASPVLLPSLPAKATIASATASRLARELRRGDPCLEIDVGPPPMLVGETFVCPDIAIDRGRLYVEIIGFWTAPYLERKRGAYRRAGIDVVLCVDESRGCADEQLPENVMGFTRFVDAQAILRRLRKS